MTRWELTCTSAEASSRGGKISITKNCHRFDDISAVKLKRTDTTLDLSQKAKRAKEERKEEEEKVVGRERVYIDLGKHVT